jgi:hypothetical protein
MRSLDIATLDDQRGAVHRHVPAIPHSEHALDCELRRLRAVVGWLKEGYQFDKNLYAPGNNLQTASS